MDVGIECAIREHKMLSVFRSKRFREWMKIRFRSGLYKNGRRGGGKWLLGDSKNHAPILGEKNTSVNAIPQPQNILTFLRM